MASNFNLADLLPAELDTFTDSAAGGDGRTHDVKTGALLNAVEAAAMSRIQIDVRTVQTTSLDDADAPRQLVLMEQRVNEFMHIVIPTLGVERIAALPIGAKMAFMQWWVAQTNAATGKMLAGKKAVQPSPAPQPLPASSDSTA